MVLTRNEGDREGNQAVQVGTNGSGIGTLHSGLISKDGVKLEKRRQEIQASNRKAESVNGVKEREEEPSGAGTGQVQYGARVKFSKQTD